MPPKDALSDAFSIETLNCLDQRPVKTKDAQTTDELIREFPFRFKPNRLCAIYPYAPTGRDPDNQVAVREGRWLFRVRLAEYITNETVIGVIGRNGLLGLWSFTSAQNAESQARSDIECHSGLKPWKIAMPGEKTRYILDLNALRRQQNSASITAHELRTSFNLVRLVQYCDQDKRCFLRIHTLDAEHTLTFTKKPDGKIGAKYGFEPIDSDAEPTSPDAGKPNVQTGGWDQGQRIVWCLNDNSVQVGTNESELTSAMPLILSGVTRDDDVFLGGFGLERFTGTPKRPTDLPSGEKIFFHTLNIHRENRQPDKEWLLAGSNSYHLYILDKRGGLLGRCPLEGRVRGILVMDSEPDAWIDLVVLIRGAGLRCLRVWLDELNAPGKQNPQKVFLEKILGLPTNEFSPRSWLNGDDPRRQIVLLTLWSYFPEQFPELFREDRAGDGLDLTSLSDRAVDWLLHGIENFLLKAAQSKDQDGQFARHLALLGNLLGSTEYARFKVFGLLGRVNGVSLPDDDERKLALDACTRRSFDLKRDFLDQAERLLKGKRHDIHRLVGAYEVMRNWGLFGQLWTASPDGDEPVRAVTMVGRKIKQVAQIYANDQGNRLHAFYIDADAQHCGLSSTEEWEKDLAPPHEDPRERVSALISLDHQQLVVAKGASLGLATAGCNNPVHWRQTGLARICTAAARKNDDDTYLIVTGGQSKPGKANTLLHGHLIGTDQDWQKSFPDCSDIPAQWHSHHTLAALTWDGEDLWGITREEGRILKWPAASRLLVKGEKLAAEEFKRLGNGQHSLAIVHSACEQNHETWVICGGVDGVARCFDSDGVLHWSLPTGGPIRAIRPLPAIIPNGRPELAILSENQHLYRVRLDGEVSGLLFLPGLHPVAMHSGSTGFGVHHLIGTLEGQVLLVEDIPAEVKTSPGRLYQHALKTCGETACPQDVEAIDLAVMRLASERQQLESRCKEASARAEPLTAAWAARQLLEQHHIQPVITLLDAIKSDFTPSLRVLRALIASSLGPLVTTISKEDLNTLLELNEDARDGAFASLIDKVSPQTFTTLPTRFARATIKKVVSEGRPFTTAALLRLMRRFRMLNDTQGQEVKTRKQQQANSPSEAYRPAETDQLQRQLKAYRELIEFYLGTMLRVTKRNVRPPPGLADGLLSLAFELVNQKNPSDPEEHPTNHYGMAALTALAGIPRVFPDLAGHLYRRERLWDLFMELLIYHGERMVAPARATAGRRLLQLVITWRKDDTRGWETRLKRLYLDLKRESNSADVEQSPDVIVLEDFFAQLPGKAPGKPVAPWHEVLPSVTELVDCVRPLYGDDLTPADSDQRLKTAKKLLDQCCAPGQTPKPKSKDPIAAKHLRCFKPFQHIWFEAWKKELHENLPARLLPETHADNLRLEAGDVFKVANAPVPVQLTLCNVGVIDIPHRISFWIEGTHNFIDGAPQHVTAEEGLRHGDGHTSCLTLDTNIIVPRGAKTLDLSVFWEVKNERRNKELALPLKHRWDKFSHDHPKTNERAIGLLTKHESQQSGSGYRVRRLVVWVNQEMPTSLAPSDAFQLTKKWAEHAGRNAIWRSPEKYLNREVRPFDASEWQDQLQSEPPMDKSIEIWILGPSIPWTLDLLAEIERSTATALILPQLAVDDRQALSEPERACWHRILDLHLPCELAALRWALKACVHSIHYLQEDQIATLEPSLLGADVNHTDGLIPRATRPTPEQWCNPPAKGWPISAAPLEGSAAELADDPARPLAALVGKEAFAYLQQMGMITQYGGRWTPRSAAIFDYVDGIFPQPPTLEESAQWSSQQITQARTALFGFEMSPPSSPPYQLLNSKEWQKIDRYLNRHDTLNGADALLMIDEHHGWKAAFDKQQSWQSVLNRKITPLLQRLREQDMSQDGETETVVLAGHELSLARFKRGVDCGPFSRLHLLVPTTAHQQEIIDQSHDLAQSWRAILNELEKKFPRDSNDNSPLYLTLSADADDYASGRLRSPENLVFLGSREINRLMSADAFDHALHEITIKQVRPTVLSRGFFKAGNGTSEFEFFGRKVALSELTAGLDKGSFVVTGPRGIGKTSFLHRLPISTEWSRLGGRFIPLIGSLQAEGVQENYGRLLQWLLKLAGINDAPLNERLALLSKVEEERQGKKLRKQEHNQAKAVIADVLSAIEHASEGLTPVFLLDEFEEMYEYDKRHGQPLFEIMRGRDSDKLSRFVFAAYPVAANGMAAGSKMHGSASYNFLTQIALGPLEREESQDLLCDGLARVGVDLDKDTTQQLAEAAFRVPVALKRTCSAVCSRLDKQIESGGASRVGAALVQALQPEIQRQLLKELEVQLATQPDDDRGGSDSAVEQRQRALYGLIHQGVFEFDTVQLATAFREHADIEVSMSEAQQRVFPLLSTLILEQAPGGQYRFSGPISAPYLPTLVRSIHET